MFGAATFVCLFSSPGGGFCACGWCGWSSLQHTDYLRDVFLLLNEPETRKGGQKREDILSFLRELFNMAKTLQVYYFKIHSCVL